MLSLWVIADIATLPVLAKAQSLADLEGSFSTVASTTPAQPDFTCTRPAPTKRLRSYAFDTFGPYPIVAAVGTAGTDQATNTPREWKQGAAGYGKRFGCDFGIAAVSTTMRYALSGAFKQDPLYYRCVPSAKPAQTGLSSPNVSNQPDQSTTAATPKPRE